MGRGACREPRNVGACFALTKMEVLNGGGPEGKDDNPVIVKTGIERNEGGNRKRGPEERKCGRNTRIR